MKRVRVRPALFIMVFVFAQAVVGAQNAVDDSLAMQTASRPSIIETLAIDTEFTMLVDAIGFAGLVEMLAMDAPFTLLAPNDSAFARLNKETLDRIFESRKSVKQLMAGLIITREYDTEALLDADAITTLDKHQMAITKQDNRLMVGDAVVISKDIKCSNGVIHVIDTVPLPPAEEKTSSIP
jgi:transforming growth factor-beta-induced protein